MDPIDSFASTSQPVPTQVKQVFIHLNVIDGTPHIYAGNYLFNRLDDEDEIVDTRAGNLVPHLSGSQITTIKAFLDAMLQKAQDSI